MISQTSVRTFASSGDDRQAFLDARDKRGDRAMKPENVRAARCAGAGRGRAPH
jgi:hypothetical protein